MFSHIIRNSAGIIPFDAEIEKTFKDFNKEQFLVGKIILKDNLKIFIKLYFELIIYYLTENHQIIKRGKIFIFICSNRYFVKMHKFKHYLQK